MLKPLLFVGLLCLLASTSRSTSAISSLPAVATYAETFDQTRIVGLDDMTIRAFEGRGADRRERWGVECRAEAQEFTIRFQAPARLLVPAMKRRPSNLLVTCNSLTGSGRIRVTPGLKRARPRMTGHVAVNVALAGIVTGLEAASNTWSYGAGRRNRIINLR